MKQLFQKGHIGYKGQLGKTFSPAELRFNIDNCRTLCARCHYKITYGKEPAPSITKWGFTPLRSKN